MEKKMLICNVYHEGNKKFAQAQVNHIRNKHGKIPYPFVYFRNQVGPLDLAGLSDNIIQVDVDLTNYKYPFVTSEGFRCAAKFAMGENQDFVWLEPDVYINKGTFGEELEKALLDSNKSAVLTSCCHPPLDIITGIGAYKSHVHDTWKRAIDTPTHAWDLAAVWWFSHDFVRSDLIWHCYANYFNGRVDPYVMELNQLGSAVVAHKVWDIGVFDR